MQSMKIKLPTRTLKSKIYSSKSTNQPLSPLYRTYPKDSKKSTPSFIEFAEIVNARCAMQGFIWGGIMEETTGNSIIEQVYRDNKMDNEGVLHAVSIIAIVTLATAITRIDKPGYNQIESSLNVLGTKYNFEPTAELVNGRLAMLGMLGLILLNI